MAGANFKDESSRPHDRGRRFPRFFRRRRRGRHLWHERIGAGSGLPLSLLEVPAGYRARIEGFVPDLSPARKSQLQAYGLVPGYWVEVLQHSPVTVVKIEQSEMAMENDLARMVWVAEIGPGEEGFGRNPSSNKSG
jgi:Fe2+ transport system protein FeoA